MSFAWPWSFLFVLPLAAAAWRMLRRRTSGGIRFPAIARLPGRRNGLRTKLAALAPWCFLAGAALLVLACARPRQPLARESRKVDAIAIAMTVDVSGSMEALDLASRKAKTVEELDTRLDVVKELFAKFVEARPDDLIGLVTFGGYASARMPLTADHEALLHVLKGVQIPTVAFDANGQPVDGEETMTAIGDGLSVALARLKSAEVKSKIVILLSDGVSNTGAVKPEEAAEAAAKLGIRVYTIGVGTRAARTPFRTKDMFGRATVQYANTSFDESQLKNIAKKTTGRYFAVNDAKGLKAALEEIDALEKTTLDRTVYQRYREFFPPFLYAGVACVFLALFLKGLIRSTNRLTPLQKLFLFFAFACLAAAAARPRWGHSMQKLETRSRNVVVALDVSRSMLARDVRPNRLERAKADIADLVDALEGDRCALVAFRNKGALLCPLTTDRGFLRGALEAASPDSAPKGETDLGAAVRTSLDALDPAQGENSAIILISDGGDLRGHALDMAAVAAKRNVPVFTVGIGDPKRETTIPDASGKGEQMYKGAPVKTKLEEKALAAIAKASGGRYVALATAGMAETTLGAIYRRFLRQVAAKEQAEEAELRATERFGVFLLPGLLLMLAAGMLSKGRFAPRRRRAAVRAVACVAVLLGTVCVRAEAAADTEVAPPADAPAVEETETDVWNRGVEQYRAGDVTNALATLKNLTVSKNYGARAAEVVGALEYKQAQAALASEDPSVPLAALEQATVDMQSALRAAPDDPRVQRNFTRAADRLPELRERAHVAQVLKRMGQQDASAILGADVRDVRAALTDFPAALTNAAPRAIASCERLAARLEQIGDSWIVLKAAIARSVTNEQQAATITMQVEEARAATQRAAEKAADLDFDAEAELVKTESALTRFWKMSVMPPAACAADLEAQTNVIAGAATIGGRDWQQEALEFTRAFRARFPMWAQAYEQQYQQKVQQGDTNAVPFTKEAQQEINTLSMDVEKMQMEMLSGAASTNAAQKVLLQEDSMMKLRRMQELLPKDPNGGQGQQNQQHQQQQQQQQQQQDQKQNQQQQPQDQQQQQDRQQQQQPEEQKQDEQKQAEEAKADADEKKDEKVEDVLRKAQERNDEHEKDKKARLRSSQLPPNERDW